MMRVTKKLYALLIAGMMAVSLAGCQSTNNSSDGNNAQSEQSSKGSTNSSTKSVSSNDIPDFSGNMTVAVDNNNPDFTSKDLTTKSYESYSRLDSEGRCQVAEACVGKDIMPKGKRGTIGMVKPTGWHTAKYNNVDGKYLYNRCHLIAYQLTGENANNKNLITGTRSFNVDGMLPYEEMVGDYVRETGNHVLYRVTPVFDGDDLVAKGVQMEAMSVEDKGEDIKFNVFVYNVQDGVKIDYETGDSERIPKQARNIIQIRILPITATVQTAVTIQTAKVTEATKIQQQRKQIRKQVLHRKFEETADQKFIIVRDKETMTVWEHQNI